MSSPRFIPLPPRESRADEEISRRATEFYGEMSKRRTVRNFSTRPVPRDVVENCIRTAATAPSGANLQPWQFVAISDARLKQQIRQAAEAEEREFYENRAPAEWLDAAPPSARTLISRSWKPRRG